MLKYAVSAAPFEAYETFLISLFFFSKSIDWKHVSVHVYVLPATLIHKFEKIHEN